MRRSGSNGWLFGILQLMIAGCTPGQLTSLPSPGPLAVTTTFRVRLMASRMHSRMLIQPRWQVRGRNWNSCVLNSYFRGHFRFLENASVSILSNI